jgi:hypothetical protein
MVRQDLQEPSSAGAYTNERLIPFLQRAIDDVWEELTAMVEGPGRVHDTITITAGDPDGYVPGTLVPMPARWQRLVIVYQNGRELVPGRPDRADLGITGRYWIDGPNQVEDGGGLLVPSSANLLTSQAWSQGDTLEWLYTELPPLWVDPSDSTIDVQVDLVSPAIASGISAVAAARANARGDSEGYQRAQAQLAQAMAKFRARREDQQQKPRALRDYVRPAGYRRLNF